MESNEYKPKYYDSTVYHTKAEVVSCALTGISRKNETALTLITYIRRYGVPISLAEDSASLGDFISEKSVNVSLVPVGEKMYENCGTKPNKDLVCTVAVQFNPTDVVQVQIVTTTDISITDIESLIEVVLNKADKVLN